MKSSWRPLLFALLGAMAPSAPVLAQQIFTQPGLSETQAHRDAHMQWWRDARFGMFIHWGPVSLKGTEISISRSPNPYGPNPGGIPADEYDNLYKQFNPVKFDAKAIVALAKAAGMKYIVFTAKHHDGFSMFDSQYTDYKITSPESPYGKDIVKQLADACHEAGLHWCVYYSQPDLHHPDYRKNQARYNEYFHNQVHELLTKYGPVDSIWFDGLGGSSEMWDAPNLFRQMRVDNPNLIINDRCGLPGDYYTPEQRIGKYDNDRDWETCMTIGDQWAYAPNDNYKSSAQCIQTLARCNGGSGNFLLNIGLQPDGAVEATQTNRLQAMATWMKTNSEAIYGTRGGPYLPSTNYASTRKGNLVYIHVFSWKNNEVVLPGLPARVLRSWVLGNTNAKAKVKQRAGNLSISVPVAAHDGADTVVALQLESSALDLAPIAPNMLKAQTTASVVYENDSNYDSAKAFDDDPNSRWATPNGTKQAWLQADFLQPTNIRGVTINEAYAGRVQKFQLQYQTPNSPNWVTILEGMGLGANYTAKFKPVTAQSVRLNILDATEGPTISQMTFDIKK